MNNKCPRCGFPLADGSVFCTNCGAKAAPTSPQVQEHSKRRPSILSITAVALSVVLILGLWKPGFLWVLQENLGWPPNLSGASVAGDNHADALLYADPAAEFVMQTEYGIAPVNQVEILMKEGKGKQEAQAVAEELGAEIVGELSFIQLYQLQTQGKTPDDLADFIEGAAAHPDVACAGANQMLFCETIIKGTPLTGLADPLYNEGTNGASYDMINLENAWKILRASGTELSPVRVGVADAPRYEGSDETGGSKFVGDTTNVKAKDAGGNVIDGGLTHGTFVSHIIGADENNGGITGIAANLKDKLTIENADVMTGPEYTPANPDPNDPTKLVYHGTTYLHNTLAHLKKLADNGCKVINCSFGLYTLDAGAAFEQVAYRKFFAKMSEDYPDVVFVASAGNGADKQKIAGSVAYHCPGGIEAQNLITVGALNPDGTRADFSGFQDRIGYGGGELTVSACGVDIPVGVDADGNTVVSSGTSFATPQVTAAIAILQAVNPKLTARQIKAIISETASPGVSGKTASVPIPEGMGAGVLNIEEAVLKVLNDKRLAEGKEPFTRETLLGLSTLELTATGGSQTSGLLEYTIDAELGVVGKGGTDVVIEVSGEHVLSGTATKHLAGAGGVSWQVSIPEPGNYLKVTRADTGAGAWLILAGDDAPLTPLKTLKLDESDFDVNRYVTFPDEWILKAFYHAGEIYCAANGEDLTITIPGCSGTSTDYVDTEYNISSFTLTGKWKGIGRTEFNDATVIVDYTEDYTTEYSNTTNIIGHRLKITLYNVKLIDGLYENQVSIVCEVKYSLDGSAEEVLFSGLTANFNPS